MGGLAKTEEKRKRNKLGRTAEDLKRKTSESGAAIEEAAKEMLTYLEHSEELQVVISELKEQLETAEETGFTIRSPSRRGRREAKSSSRFSEQGENQVYIRQFGEVRES